MKKNLASHFKVPLMQEHSIEEFVGLLKIYLKVCIIQALFCLKSLYLPFFIFSCSFPLLSLTHLLPVLKNLLPVLKNESQNVSLKYMCTYAERKLVLSLEGKKRTVCLTIIKSRSYLGKKTFANFCSYQSFTLLQKYLVLTGPFYRMEQCPYTACEPVCKHTMASDVLWSLFQTL